MCCHDTEYTRYSKYARLPLGNKFRPSLSDGSQAVRDLRKCLWYQIPFLPRRLQHNQYMCFNLNYSLSEQKCRNTTPSVESNNFRTPLQIVQKMTNSIDRHGLESISSRIQTYFGSILRLWNHATCLRCVALTYKLTWNFITAAPVSTW